MQSTDFSKEIFDASVYVESYEIKLASLQIEREQLSKQFEAIQ